MEHDMTKTRLCALLLVTVALEIACASVTINKVLADPTRYRDQQITISGQVSDSFSVASRGAYKIRDGSGELWVISEQGVPRTGAEVKVTGRVREGYNVGSLGPRLPAGLGSGLVLVESSHSAK
jgi:hypothetical protein